MKHSLYYYIFISKSTAIAAVAVAVHMVYGKIYHFDKFTGSLVFLDFLTSASISSRIFRDFLEYLTQLSISSSSVGSSLIRRLYSSIFSIYILNIWFIQKENVTSFFVVFIILNVSNFFLYNKKHVAKCRNQPHIHCTVVSISIWDLI